jgi:hypothetical protein
MVPIVSHKSLTCADTPIYKMCPDIRNLGGLDPDGVWSKEGDGGGAILNVGGGIITMISTTVAHNLTIRESGGGIYNDPESYAEIFYTIIAKNYYYKNRETLALAANDCKGTLESFGYNLVGVEGSSCTVPPGPGDKFGSYGSPLDPKFSVKGLYQNGGPTPTHALLPGSPAIDAGNPDGSCATNRDQRHIPRPQDGPTENGYDGVAICDIGAYEHEGQ